MRARVGALSRRHGFDACGIAAAVDDPHRAQRLAAWLEAGHAGDMAWMARELERRASPVALWPAARSIIMLGVNYASEGDPLLALAARDRATLALYAMRKDYHDVIKGRLKTFAQALIAEAGGEVKVFVDTAPVMEKPLAALAGIGWQGRHSALVSREFGDWLLLGAVFTTLEIAPDTPETDHCGSCRRCLDICPTEAFPAPYTVDSRRCISYLTIEHKGTIPRALRARFGNRVFGCDDCLAVCPWNKFAQASRDVKLALRGEFAGMRLAELAAMDDAAFRARFAGTPVKRTGRDRFLRNVLIAIGNSGDAALIDHALPRLGDESPLVRAMAVWALSRLMPPAAFGMLAGSGRPHETDPDVLAEWHDAMAETKGA